MPLFSEYAITPGVFDSATYEVPQLCEFQIRQLQASLLSHAVVRDLADGAWSRQFANGERAWASKTKELICKLGKQNRLARSPLKAPRVPTTEDEWCEEAWLSDSDSPLSGVVTSDHVALVPGRNHARVTTLSGAPWWTPFDATISQQRTAEAYLRELRPIMRHARSVYFVDPYFDPNDGQYRWMRELFKELGRRDEQPLIRVYRANYVKSGDGSRGQDKRPNIRAVRALIDEALLGYAHEFRLSIEVHLRGEMHDRHLITDFIAIHMGHGFSATTDRTAYTTWARHSRSSKEAVERECDRKKADYVLPESEP